MNEDELEACLSSHNLTKDLFKGCFARDEIEFENLSHNSLYVVNTDTRSSEGEHWVLVFCGQQYKFPLYFDSYGLPPLHREINNFMLHTATKYIYNKQQLQGFYSSVCGHYVAYIAAQLSAGERLEDLRERRFSNKNFNNNDKAIVGLFRKEFGYPRTSHHFPYKVLTCKCRCDYENK